MSAVMDAATAALVVVGGFFFMAGTAGVVRFPDVFTRLHALTKADNLGLGFIVLGLAVQAGQPLAAAKLVLVWLLVVLSAATTSQLVARTALGREPPAGEPPP